MMLMAIPSIKNADKFFPSSFNIFFLAEVLIAGDVLWVAFDVLESIAGVSAMVSVFILMVGSELTGPGNSEPAKIRQANTR